MTSLPSEGLQYEGSFQTGTRLTSENPLEEAWSRIAIHGSDDFLREQFSWPPRQNVEPFIEYAGVRVRQAVEFREATRQSTLLTSPLSLYYSFLNLTRAIICLHSDVLPPGKHHGLTFQRSTDLLSTGARIAAQQGTFTDYLDATGTPWKASQVVTLHDALSRINEIQFDYTRSYGQKSLVIPINVAAYTQGLIRLHISSSVYDLSAPTTDWTTELPSLASCCHVEVGKNTLRVLDAYSRGSYQSVSEFCSLRLDRSLIWQDTPDWFLVRQTDPDLVFPRLAYYFIVVFILGSIVRYEPELLIEMADPKSRSGWFFNKVVQAAERFYPQLLLSWFHRHPYYF